MFENTRVDHSAAQDLQPSCALADPTIGSIPEIRVAKNARYVEFRTGFDERKVTGTETNFTLAVEPMNELG